MSNPNANAAANGQACAKCGMKAGAHEWPNIHPRACREWRTAYDLQREREEDDGAWMFDSDMEAKG